MKSIQRYITLSIAILSLSLPLTACGGDDGGGGANPDAGVQPKSFPTNIGAQIDRMGRPAISTALIESLLYADATSQGAGKDAYNLDPEVSSWTNSWSAEIAKNLAVLDGLDAAGGTTGCGNQFGFGAGGKEAYGFLSEALADDRLLIDPTIPTCDQYLALEAGVAGQCGGRHPNMDVIETSYSALAAGGLTGIDDGVASDNVTHSITAFPYLAGPS